MFSQNKDSEEMQRFRKKSITVSFDPTLKKNRKAVPVNIQIQKLTTLKSEYSKEESSQDQHK